MANIQVTSKHTIFDGMSVTFRAPCDCTEVEGLTVCDERSTQTFRFKDAHGNELVGLGDLFVSGVYIKAILDTGNGFAYLQNADNNTFLDALRQYVGAVDAKMEFGSYTGSGASLATIEFDRAPSAVLIVGGGSYSYQALNKDYHTVTTSGVGILSAGGGFAATPLYDYAPGSVQSYVGLSAIDVREFGQTVTWTSGHGINSYGGLSNSTIEPGEPLLNTGQISYQYIAFFDEEE